MPQLVTEEQAAAGGVMKLKNDSSARSSAAPSPTPSSGSASVSAKDASIPSSQADEKEEKMEVDGQKDAEASSPAEKVEDSAEKKVSYINKEDM